MIITIFSNQFQYFNALEAYDSRSEVKAEKKQKWRLFCSSSTMKTLSVCKRWVIMPRSDQTKLQIVPHPQV